ncbi:amidohydrolase family protein [Anthocerotibacter panamensis]|uniref:amidohydrolase family protein n=1 Tax=Anthocerotibacter panamensis TaxID=2857077 RepID=UPI001C404548|nr:amidohydrolase family protein [Anthocerotibacter panamensis]
MRQTIPLLLLLATLSAPSLQAQEQIQVFRGAKIYPISGPPIAKGTLIVHKGKIVAVGPADQIAIPNGAKITEVTGKVLMPGLVDTHSHVGEGDGADRSAPLNPEIRILDALNVRSATLNKARAGGITTVNVMPGSGHLLSGQTVYLKLRAHARTINDLLYCKDPLKDICGGLKMANGTNSIGEPPFPGTRAKSAALARQMFVKARQYRDKIKAAKGDPQKLPERDLQMEALVQVLDGKRIVHFHTHRQDDILTAIRLGQEFGFRPVLHHVSEAWKVAQAIAAAGVPCSIITLDSPGGKLETVDLSMENGAALEKAGVPVAYHTDDGITDSRWFLRSAAIGVRAGMTRTKALEAMTLTGAKMLGLDQRVGSLEPGKDADFILLSGDPLSVYSHIEQTWVEGQNVFDRANSEERTYAVGGYEVFRTDYEDDHAKGEWE